MDRGPAPQGYRTQPRVLTLGNPQNKRFALKWARDILSPTTLCIPIVLLTVLARDRSRNCRSPFTGRFPVLASPLERRARQCILAESSSTLLCLWTGLSLPVALHPASRRRSYLQLRTGQCSRPERTFTLLLVRTFMRTSGAPSGLQMREHQCTNIVSFLRSETGRVERRSLESLQGAS